jgi:hypothetical protein
MHSLADYTVNDIRAAVLSFIQKHETGTYAKDNHLLKFEHKAGTVNADYRMGCHHWKFTFLLLEVYQPGINN